MADFNQFITTFTTRYTAIVLRQDSTVTLPLHVLVSAGAQRYIFWRRRGHLTPEKKRVSNDENSLKDYPFVGYLCAVIVNCKVDEDVMWGFKRKVSKGNDDGTSAQAPTLSKLFWKFYTPVLKRYWAYQKSTSIKSIYPSVSMPHIRVLTDVIPLFTHQWLTITTTLQHACDGPPLLPPVRLGGHSLSTKRLVLFQSLRQFTETEPVSFDFCPIFALQTLGGTRKVLHYASGLHCQATIVFLCCKLCWTANIWPETESRCMAVDLGNVALFRRIDILEILKYWWIQESLNAQ